MEEKDMKVEEISSQEVKSDEVQADIVCEEVAQDATAENAPEVTIAQEPTPAEDAPVAEEKPAVEEKVKKERSADYFSMTINKYGITGAIAVVGFALAFFFLIQEIKLFEIFQAMIDKVAQGTPVLEVLQANLAYVIPLAIFLVGVLTLAITGLVTLWSKKCRFIDEAVFISFALVIGLLVQIVIEQVASKQDLIGLFIFLGLIVLLLLVRVLMYKPKMSIAQMRGYQTAKANFGSYSKVFHNKFNTMLTIALACVAATFISIIFLVPAAREALNDQAVATKFTILMGIGGVGYIVGMIIRCVRKRVNMIDLVAALLGVVGIVIVGMSIYIGMSGGEGFNLEAAMKPLIMGVVCLVVSIISMFILGACTYVPIEAKHEEFVNLKCIENDVIFEEPVEEEPAEEVAEEPVEEVVEEPAEEPVEEVAEELVVEEEPIEEPVDEESVEEVVEPVEEPTRYCTECGAPVHEDDKFCPECGFSFIPAEEAVEEQVEEVAAEPVVEEEPADEVANVSEEDMQAINDKLDKLESSIAALSALDNNDHEQRIVALEQNTNTINSMNERIDKIELNVQRILDLLLAGAVVTATQAAEPVEEPVEEEPIEEIPAVVPAAKPKLSTNWQAEVEDDSRVKPKFSFEMKMRLADDDIKSFYSEIKNELLSYGIKNRISRFRENFNKGRNQIARFAINGKTLVLYLAIDPDSLDESYYHHKSCLDKKGAQDVPTMLKIRSKVAVKKAKQLIELICESLVIKKKPKYEPEDFASQFSLDGYTTVECKGLDYLVVGDIDLGQAMQLPDGLASQLIEVVEGDEAVFNPITATVSVDALMENFEDGDVVDIEAVRAKGLCDADCNYLEIVEGQRLNKKLRVFANEYNPDAVKMICIAGGEAFLIVDPQ